MQEVRCLDGGRRGHGRGGVWSGAGCPGKCQAPALELGSSLIFWCYNSFIRSFAVKIFSDYLLWARYARSGGMLTVKKTSSPY